MADRCGRSLSRLVLPSCFQPVSAFSTQLFLGHMIEALDLLGSQFGAVIAFGTFVEKGLGAGHVFSAERGHLFGAPAHVVERAVFDDGVHAQRIRVDRQEFRDPGDLTLQVIFEMGVWTSSTFGSSLSFHQEAMMSSRSQH